MIKKAQLLLLTFLLLIIVGILGSSLMVLWEDMVDVRSLQEKKMEAFYLAQAGLEEGKYEVRENSDFGGSQWWPDPYSDPLDPLYDLSAPCVDEDSRSPCWHSDFSSRGWHRFRVVKSGNDRIIEGRGRVIDSGGNILAERRIEVTINSSSGAQDSYSWREL
ncbi:MAG: hypothetical protein GY858_01960 [Candidatus Omnitrophica bacterium]|nr:hypothetical protein [Candidatus Omnitrophota bacterium]